MDQFRSLVVFLSLLVPFTHGHPRGTLSFNTSTPQTGQHYLSYTGETLLLICKSPDGARNIKLLKGGTTIQSAGSSVLLRNVDETDASRYTCRYETCSIFCFLTLFWSSEEVSARLLVVTPRMTKCILSNGFQGRFFVGDYFELVCPKNINFDVFIGPDGTPLTYNVGNVNGDLATITVSDISAANNNSRLRCITSGKDYCKSVPTITVYDDLEVNVYPQTVEVTDGENITFTCRSFPELQASVEWNFSAIRNIVSFASESQAIQGSRNVTLTFNFQNLTEAYDHNAVIKCRVVMGSKNKTNEINIIPQYQQRRPTTDVTITSVASTTVPSKVETTDTTLERKEEEHTKDKEKQRLSPIIIPAVIILSAVFGITGLIFIGICKGTKRNVSSTRETDINMPSANHQNSELQLSTNDSEVIHNIIYEPYTQKQL